MAEVVEDLVVESVAASSGASWTESGAAEVEEKAESEEAEVGEEDEARLNGRR